MTDTRAPRPRRPGPLAPDFYDDAEVHRRMVGDAARTDAFRDSIAATVRPGNVVLDVGAGSGILSLFAAQAGAARVYAVERAAGAAAIARRMVADNGFADVVQVIDADLDRAVIGEPVDVIVSEWLGVYGVDENMLPPLVAARDRWLRSGGTVIPGSVTTCAAPVFHSAADEVLGYHDRSRYGLDLSALAPFPLDEAVCLPAGADSASLRAGGAALWSVDPMTASTAEAASPFAGAATFTVDGPVNGLLVWFSAEMPGAEPLTNGPGAPVTHWGQFLFPFLNGSTLTTGGQLRVEFHCVPTPGPGSHHIWSTQVGGGPREVHDTRRVPRPPYAPSWRVSEAT